MAIKTPPQVIVNESTDSSLNHIYTTDLQSITGLETVGTVFITNKQEYVTNYYTDNKPGGDSGEVQLNIGGKIAGDDGLRYDAIADSLTVSGNVLAGNVRTDNLLYANGVAWSLGSGGSGNYANSNVAAYLPTYTGNVGAGNIKTNNLLYANGVAWNFAGTYSNSNVADYLPTYTGAITASSVTATTFNGAATRAGTVTASAQPNIRSVGPLTSLSVTGSTSLGLVGNVQIDGGTSGQYLITNGSGSLSWTDLPTPSTPTLQTVTGVGATTSNKITISDDTDSTSYSSASALKVVGGISVGKTIHTGSHVSSETTFFAGHLADFSDWNVPKFIGRDAGSEYIQGALINTQETGSADWVAYGDQSDDTMGWMDMGFTGSNFSDPTYSITKSNDGYIICQGMPGQGGNLVIATGDLGGATHRDIVFATGGFLLDDERMRLNHEDSTFFIGAHGEAGGTNVTNLDVNGNVTLRSRTTLGAVANVKITGGTSGYVLSTDGTGNLSWVAQSGGTVTGNITFSGDTIGSSNDIVNVSASNYVQLETTDGSDSTQIWTELGNAVVQVNGTAWRFNSPTVAGASSNAFEMPNGIMQRSGDHVTCVAGVDTVIYTSALATNHTIKLVLNIEGVEDGQTDTDTQSCEMIVAKGIRANSVAGSAYGLVYTSTNPLVTLSTRWNAIDSRVEVTCRPVSATNQVSVRSTGIEVAASGAG